MATSKLGRLFGRTETAGRDENPSIHAEKNQDIEVENDETHALGVRRAAAGVWDDTDIVHVVGADGPSTLIALPGEMGDLQTATTAITHISGDWNGDGSDTIGFSGVDGDADGDADFSGADLS